MCHTSGLRVNEVGITEYRPAVKELACTISKCPWMIALIKVIADERKDLATLSNRTGLNVRANGPTLSVMSLTPSLRTCSAKRPSDGQATAQLYFG